MTTWTNSSQNTATWTVPAKPGGTWEYNQSGVDYNEAGYTYNGIGAATSWTNATKS